MKHHSILKDSVSGNSVAQTLNQVQQKAFRNGVNDSCESHLLHSLFHVRTNQLFGNLSKEENFFYLSGLLIGAELQTLRSSDVGNFMICSGSNLYDVYELAMHELGLQTQTNFVVPELIDKIVVEGQIKVFQHFNR
jgi:2-dehydro-3-deoxygalactonokinase